MFFEMLERLRNWPEVKRQLAAMVFSGAVVAVIFAIWITSLIYSNPTTVNSPEQTASSIQVADIANGGEVASPWATVTGAFRDVVNQISDRIKNFGSDFSKFEVVNSATIPTSTSSSSSVATTTP